jgi:DNA-binding NarL/FixJ family response regulator
MKIEVIPVKILSDGRIVTDGARRLLPSKDKVRLRRDKIIQCMANGITQEEISMEVKCSLSTIEKDIKAIRDGL